MVSGRDRDDRWVDGVFELRFTRRLNSATAIGLAETSLDAKRSVARWLAERAAPLVVGVTPLTHPIVAGSCAAESWAVGRGARSMAVQVLGTNAAARRLYERLGYVGAYRYHYLQAATR